MPKRNLYNVNSMESAIREVQCNALSLRAAAKVYGVPKSTLEFKLKNPGHKDTCGPSPILSAREESEMVKPFLEDILQRTSEAVSAASACVSEENIRKWFREIDTYLTSKNIDINDPSQVYNGDETGFQICPSTGKVFSAKGAKNVYCVEKGSPKENITVMFSFSVSGSTCPPMIIYPYKRIPEKISITVNASWGIGRSDNGWMTSDTFHDYVKHIFYPYLVDNNIKFPVILFLDGHKSHLTYELSLLCNELNIEVIALYPNATRILQPCDVAVFRPIKMGWKKAVREFYERNPGQVLNKITFAPLLEKVVKVIKVETLINGFRACGLFPFNPNAIDYSKCLGKENSSSKQIPIPPVNMDHNTFLNFIGDEIVSKFKSFDGILVNEGFKDEFLALYRIWNFFGKPDKVENTPEHDKQNSQVQEVENVEDPQLVKTPKNLEILEVVNEDAATTENEKHIVSNIKLSPLMKETNCSKVNVLQNIVIKEPDATTIPTSLPHILNLPSTSKSIGAYLNVPDKPARKNKRDIERVSFAITSRLYQENFETKRALKLEDKKRKLERKRKREAQIAAKANKENKKKLKVGVNEINNCFVCKKIIVTKTHFLSCSSCKNNFHRRCIPKKHKHHAPDLEDDVLFMCHICYKEESEEEANSESESEVEAENEMNDKKDASISQKRGDQTKIDEYKRKEKEDNVEFDENYVKPNIEDEDDIDELYNMYKREQAKL